MNKIDEYFLRWEQYHILIAMLREILRLELQGESENLSAVEKDILNLLSWNEEHLTQMKF